MLSQRLGTVIIMTDFACAEVALEAFPVLCINEH